MNIPSNNLRRERKQFLVNNLSNNTPSGVPHIEINANTPRLSYGQHVI